MKHFCVFSEAIREGAKLRGQGFWTLVRDGKTCALAAGYEALGFLDKPAQADRMYALYPYMNDERDCPTECGLTDITTAVIVSHLNDTHQWTREAIADWLESEEEKLGFVTIDITEQQVSSIQSEAGELVGV